MVQTLIAVCVVEAVVIVGLLIYQHFLLHVQLRTKDGRFSPDLAKGKKK